MTGLGQRIKEARLRLGISQTELANRLGLTSKTTICKVEKGDDNLTIDSVERYANVLDVSVPYLVTGDRTLIHYKEDTVRITKALELYELYDNAIPEIQAGVNALLQSSNRS